MLARGRAQGGGGGGQRSGFFAIFPPFLRFAIPTDSPFRLPSACSIDVPLGAIHWPNTARQPEPHFPCILCNWPLASVSQPEQLVGSSVIAVTKPFNDRHR